MEIYEEISYDIINSYGEWITVTRYELIEWNETETEKTDEE
jgi:hypothetical protein